MAEDQTRRLVRKAVFLALLFVLLVLTLPACVSVQKTGEQAQVTEVRVATVQFNSIRDPAEVYIDGAFRGSTPVTLQLTAGTHTVEFKLEGYQTWSRDLVVMAGDDTRVTAVLVPE